MKHSFLPLAAAAGTALAQQGAWEQCGGTGYTGSTSCVSGYACKVQNDYYSQCLPGSVDDSASCAVSYVTASSSVEAGPSVSVSVAPVSSSQSAVASSSAVSVAPVSSSQIAVGSSAAVSSAAPVASSQSVAAGSSVVISAPAASSSAPSSGGGSGKVSYAGINIAGFDFGCTTDGTCDLSSTTPPSNGNAQMKHFVTDDGLNAFRLPVAWQYLVNNQLGGTLDSANFATYNGLVQGCLDAGAALCIIDIHNYARWNGQIVGQSDGSVADKDLASLWSQLATKYKSNSKIAFGIINEPHDLDINTWATTVQASVTAIRAAGATSQKILLPGTDYTSAGNFIDNGSGAALKAVTNADGSTDNLIFDVHKYLDSDNSGTNAECASNNKDAFTTLGNWLRQQGRKAMLTETGGGSNAESCFTDLCEELATLNSYSDVFLGWVGWGAGAFDTSYVLSETPTESGGVWTDQPLVTKCIVGQFKS